MPPDITASEAFHASRGAVDCHGFLFANREEFKRDEEAYMNRFSLSVAEKRLIRSRDFAGMIDAGMNIYFMLKIGSVTGNSLYRMGAQMRGESYEDFLATRNFKDAV